MRSTLTELSWMERFWLLSVLFETVPLRGDSAAPAWAAGGVVITPGRLASGFPTAAASDDVSISPFSAKSKHDDNI